MCAAACPKAGLGTLSVDSLVSAPTATSVSAPELIQFSDRLDVEPYKTLSERVQRWAALRGYRYRLESERALPTHSVYWEKVRMGLEALERGSEWVLWVDDDATINEPDLRAEDWLERFPNRSLLLSPQLQLDEHLITAEHYHNWGIWLVRRDAWSLALLREMLSPSGRCADLHAECMMQTHPERAALGLGSNMVKCSNPEQDCFVRFVHHVPTDHSRIAYPFNKLGRNLDQLPLNASTMARLGEPAPLAFNCVCQYGALCRPWFLHFMEVTKDQAKLWVTPQLDRTIAIELIASANDWKRRKFSVQYNCSVVARPTVPAAAGMLRTMAAAFAFAEAQRCWFYVDWVAPVAWAETYTGSVRPPPTALRDAATVATDALARDPFGAPAVLFESEEQAERALRVMGADAAETQENRNLFRRRIMLRSRGHMVAQ